MRASRPVRVRMKLALKVSPYESGTSWDALHRQATPDRLGTPAGLWATKVDLFDTSVAGAYRNRIGVSISVSRRFKCRSTPSGQSTPSLSVQSVAWDSPFG